LELADVAIRDIDTGRSRAYITNFVDDKR